MGLLFSIAVFVMGLLPMGIDIFTFNVASSQFLNATTEMQQIVTEEGGITDRVHYIADSSTIKYTFKNEAGSLVDGIQDVGDVIYIDYQYDYKGIYTNDSLKTSNTIRVSRR